MHTHTRVHAHPHTHSNMKFCSRNNLLFSLPLCLLLSLSLSVCLSLSSVNVDRFLVFDHAHRSLVQVQPIEGETQLDHTFCLIMLENHQGKMCERLLKANTEYDTHTHIDAHAHPHICTPLIHSHYCNDCP